MIGLRQYSFPLILFVAVIPLGCEKQPPQPAPKDPTAFLKWSMDRYAEMPDFQAVV